MKRSHLEPFSPLKLALPSLGKRLGSTRAGSPGFVLRPLEIVSCPLKREGGRKRTLPPSLAWRGTMSFSLSSHKTDFERPHCLTLPLFVRRPLCREREERNDSGGSGGPKKCGFGTSNQSGMGRPGREREERAELLTPCGGRVIKSSVSCRRWRVPSRGRGRPSSDRQSNTRLDRQDGVLGLRHSSGWR